MKYVNAIMFMKEGEGKNFCEIVLVWAHSQAATWKPDLTALLCELRSSRNIHIPLL